jgi:hypothetical protein
MATSMGVSVGSDGNLYELFSDGTRVLKEAGYQARIDKFVQTQNTSNVNSPMPTTPATPATPPAATASVSTASNTVKTATPDIILFDDGLVPIEIMTDLIFENIGGQELINIARGDIINGQKITYQPIKNISDIERQYNPNNIIGLQDTSDTYFSNFPIQITDKVPNVGSGLNGEYVYLNSTNNDLTIDVINMQNDEQVEIQIGTDGTIYEAEL